MDGSRFDAAVRGLGERRTRRGVVGLLAALAAGSAASEAEARKRCRPKCPAGQRCRKGACACDNGGTVCGVNCCLLGQECRDGQCVTLPEPTTCIAYGEPCKGVGKPCCENLACGSGQGGQDDVACYVRKTGRCTSTAECTFGTECVDGVCVGLPICNVELGDPCGPQDICCAGTCNPEVIVGARGIAQTSRCCVALGAACDVDRDCCSVLPPTSQRPRDLVVIECRNRVCVESLD